MAVGQQRGAGLYGPHESFERGRAIVRYHGEADATGTRIEIFRVLASWPGLIGVAIDHLDGPDDEDFASIAGLEECVALAEGDFRLIDFNDPFERFSVWVDHRSPQLLRPWRAPSRRLPLSGIGPANDIPIARRRVARRQAEQFFERRMPVKAAIVANRSIRKCMPGSSARPRGRCRKRDKRIHPASDVRTRRPRSSPRRETPTEIR